MQGDCHCFENYLFREIILLIFVACIHFVFNDFAVEIYPQEQHVPIGSINIAGGEDGGGLFKTGFGTLMQMDG